MHSMVTFTLEGSTLTPAFIWTGGWLVHHSLLLVKEDAFLWGDPGLGDPLHQYLEDFLIYFLEIKVDKELLQSTARKGGFWRGLATPHRLSLARGWGSHLLITGRLSKSLRTPLSYAFLWHLSFLPKCTSDSSKSYWVSRRAFLCTIRSKYIKMTLRSFHITPETHMQTDWWV